MLTDVDDEFNRPPEERASKKKLQKVNEKKKNLKLQYVDQSKQDNWLDRTRQGLHCSTLCGGRGCKLENWETLNPIDKQNVAIEGLNSNWVGEHVIASQRLSTSLFVKYPIIQQFKEKKVTGVLNLQEKGEHSHCGPDGVYANSGYSYNGPEDLMPHGIAYYEFPWPDMTAPEQDVVLRSVQVMDYHVKNKGKVLVHCHAGLGRTGLMIACYYVYSRHVPSEEAIALVRETRPGAIQTKRQAQFVDDFEQHLWRLSQAFRVEISDALIDVNLFIQRQRQVLHGEKSDLYRCVPMFLHTVLCRLVQLTKDNLDLSTRAMQYLGPSSAPDDATLSACRIAINRRRFKVQNVSDVSVLSFLVCDWFRSMAAPALSIEDCDEIVRYKRNYFGQQEQLLQEIRRIISKPVRHTIGMVISAFQTIGAVGVRETVKHFAFRCLVDSFNHAFNPIKLRHSPIEREFIHEFFFQDWAHSVGNMYFDYDTVAPAHRTIKRIALASSIILQSLEKAKPSSETPVHETAASPRQWPIHRQPVPPPLVTSPSTPFFTTTPSGHVLSPLTLATPQPTPQNPPQSIKQQEQEQNNKTMPSSANEFNSLRRFPSWRVQMARDQRDSLQRASVASTVAPLPSSLPSGSSTSQ